jgi:hypothetical protein
MERKKSNTDTLVCFQRKMANIRRGLGIREVFTKSRGCQLKFH